MISRKKAAVYKDYGSGVEACPSLGVLNGSQFSIIPKSTIAEKAKTFKPGLNTAITASTTKINLKTYARRERKCIIIPIP